MWNWFNISPRASKIPCLLFADDSLIFCRTNLESCQELSSVLSNFRQNYGELINFHKSSLTFSSNASIHDKQIVSSVFNITRQDNLGKYLGCPVFKGTPTIETFSELVNRTSDKLQWWKTRYVSKAGGVALIQANIESMPAHTKQCFQLPKETNRQIDKISREFFWKKSHDNKGLPMVSWTKSVDPKRQEDLALEKWKQLIVLF